MWLAEAAERGISQGIVVCATIAKRQHRNRHVDRNIWSITALCKTIKQQLKLHCVVGQGMGGGQMVASSRTHNTNEGMGEPFYGTTDQPHVLC